MTPDETINRELHIARGLCWHEHTGNAAIEQVCKHCRKDFKFMWGGSWANVNPSYTTSLSDCFEIQEFVIEKVGRQAFAAELAKVATTPRSSAKTIDDAQGVDAILFLSNECLVAGATATARQRALACYQALKADGVIEEEK